MCGELVEEPTVQNVLLQGQDGKYLHAAMMHPGDKKQVTVVPVRVPEQWRAIRFCSIANAEKFAELLNGHAGPGYWSRVLA